MTLPFTAVPKSKVGFRTRGPSADAAMAIGLSTSPKIRTRSTTRLMRIIYLPRGPPAGLIARRADAIRERRLVERVEPQLDQPQPVVVVVPEVLEQQRIEDRDPDRLEDGVAVEVDREHQRRQLHRDVASLRLTLVAEHDHVFAGAHDLIVGGIGDTVRPLIDAAGADVSRAARLAELTEINLVGRTDEDVIGRSDHA